MTAEILFMSDANPQGTPAIPDDSYAWLTKQLSLINVRVQDVLLCCTGRREFQQKLTRALGRSELVVILGGQDSEAETPLEIVCQGIGRSMEYEERVLADLESRLHRSRSQMEERELKAALVPRDAQVFLNREGCYPGIALTAGHQAILLLPAALNEIEALWQNGVEDFVSGCSGCYAEETTLNILKKPSELQESLNGMGLKGSAAYTITPRHGYCDVHLVVREASRLTAKINMGDTVNLISSRLGSAVFGVDHPDPVRALYLRLKKTGGPLVLCGMGMPEHYTALDREFSRIDPQRRVLLPGVFSGSQQEAALLGAPKHQWKKDGGASPVLSAMIARGALKKTNASLAVAVGARTGARCGWVLLTDGQNLFEREIAPEPSLPQQVGDFVQDYLDADPALMGTAHSLEQVCALREKLTLEKDEAVRTEKPSEKKTINIATAVMVVSLCVFLFSAGYIVKNLYESHANRQQVEELVDMLAENPGFESLKEINGDVRGYLSIEGTGVHYPVVQSRDNTHYLTHDFYGNKNRHGTVFLDYEADIRKPSANMILYGHNMKDGQMFGELINYKDLDYYRQHPVIQFDTLYRKGQYKIVSVFLTSMNPEDNDLFYYNSTVNMTSPDEIQEFVGEVKRRSLIETTVDVQNTDTLLTLSTCDYAFKDSRFVIVARRVRDGESTGVDTAGARYQEDPLMPAAWYAKQK